MRDRHPRKWTMRALWAKGGRGAEPEDGWGKRTARDAGGKKKEKHKGSVRKKNKKFICKKGTLMIKERRNSCRLQGLNSGSMKKDYGGMRRGSLISGGG